MADTAAVEYLLGQLGQFASYHIKLITEASAEAEQLTNDLHYFNAFLKYASSKKIKDARVKEFVKQVRDAVYDAEDAVDAFVTQAVSLKSKSWFRKLFKGTIKLDEIAQQVQKVRMKVEDVHGEKSKLDMMLLQIGDDGTEEKLEVSQVREKNIVGLDGPANEIIEIIKKNTSWLDIVSIVGMPGLGKSTLAGKIFRDPEIQFEFPTRLWVYVSKFPPKDVFLSILREFTSITDDMRSMKEHELAHKVKGYLERGKFLIIMDDVWTPEEWKAVSRALPESNHLGKIIITSRFEDVAKFANPRRPAYKMDLLKEGPSVELLQYEVFGEPKWDPEIEPHGKLIAYKCNGLPLAIVVIGGIILKKVSSIADNTAKVAAWKKFSERVKDHLIDDPARVMDKVIWLSYQKLPYHLKACFLYFGMFPEDIEIPTWKLFRMWIAEGFVQGKNFTLEETAESYLEELISRNLVRVERKSSSGKIKTCRIHDSLRDFCKTQAGAENECFLEEIKRSKDGALPLLENNTSYRRVCVHSDISQFVASKPCGSRVRSFVCFSKEELALQAEYISAIPGGFKLLRVLDVRPIKFPKIPPDMYELLHLRYIHLSIDASKLPQAFSKLLNMQTLIVDTSHRILEINADIWKMRNLRSVKTNATATLPQPTKDSAQEESNVQSLGTISSESCTDVVLDKARNLRRVSICGNLSKLLTGKSNNGCSFENIRKLGKLEKLKLKNDAFPLPPSDGKMPYLPPSHVFPPNLKILTLSDTYLDWSEMKVLSSLFNLEVLKLKEKAFMGNYWEVVDGGFDHLRVLFIGRTDLVVWKMSAGNFPKITHLELRNCDELREVPIEFAQKPSLDVLIVNHCRSAAASAKKIPEKKKEILEAKGEKPKEFKLSIFPPIN